jgi:hypothetical protein
MTKPTNPDEQLKRWRMVLGKPAHELLESKLNQRDSAIDETLEALYDSDRKGGLGSSSPNVARWLGDIRTYFPSSVVQVMQNDALERLKLTQMLFEPELLEQVEADVHLVATLLTLRSVIPNQTKDTARKVVAKVVGQLEKRLRNPMMQAIRGSLNKALRQRNPRGNQINWDRTIRENLKSYLPEKKTIIAEKLIGYGTKQSRLRDIVLCVDQSGSMASSVIYSSIFAAVMASMRTVHTQMVVFDTSVVDLTRVMNDPVDLLFGTQLGGGTDIDRALGYCTGLITRPSKTIFVLITDLYEGGNSASMLRRAHHLVQSGVTVICLLALSDQGAPSFDHHHAGRLANMGIPTFACTPDLFPDLMAAAIQHQDLQSWTARNDIVGIRT